MAGLLFVSRAALEAGAEGIAFARHTMTVRKGDGGGCAEALGPAARDETVDARRIDAQALARFLLENLS